MAGRRCPIAGRVSMDLLAVDVATCPRAAVRRGDLRHPDRRWHERRRSRRRAWAPSATRCSPASDGAIIGTTRTRESEHLSASALGLRPLRGLRRRGHGGIDAGNHGHDGPSRSELHLPELRRRLRPLAGQVRGLRRVEHDRRGKRRDASAAADARPRAAQGRASSRSRPLAGRRTRRAAARLRRGRSSTASPAAASCAARVLLLGGDPGIGKSTLLIQAAAALARAEPARGLHLRRGSGRAGAAARRALRPRRGAGRARRRDLGRGHHRDVVARRDRRASSIIDSIQTMWTDAVESAPGTVTQVRGAARRR